MPNTTSGTATFDKTFAIDEIVEEAYQRIGVDQLDAYQIKSARRSINIMFQEWGNRGLHYWEIDETNIDLIEGQSEYHFFRSSADDTSDSNRAQATTNQPNLSKSLKPRAEVSISAFGHLFNEITQHFITKNERDLEEELHDLGVPIGQRVLEL